MGTDLRRRITAAVITFLAVLGLTMSMGAAPASAVVRERVAGVYCAGGSWSATLRYDATAQGSFPLSIYYTKSATQDGSREHQVQFSNNASRITRPWAAIDAMRQNGAGTSPTYKFQSGQAYNMRLVVKTANQTCTGPYVSLN